jgi:hypothetical protein
MQRVAGPARKRSVTVREYSAVIRLRRTLQRFPWAVTTLIFGAGDEDSTCRLQLVSLGTLTLPRKIPLKFEV